LLVAGALLGICMVVTNMVHRREETRSGPRRCNEPLKFNAGFQLVFKQRYLLLIALLIILSNVVNTTGEFILSASVSQHADASAVLSGNAGAKRLEFIGKFYADFYFWVNVVGAGLQMFAVSRMMKYVGIGPSLFFLPMIALGSYTVLSFVPLLGLIRAAKIAENGTDYSVENTARHALFLGTSREVKYMGKTAIDSFFWRAGDAISALVVFIGTSFAFDIRTFARTNAFLATAWMFVAALIVWLRVTKGVAASEPTGPLIGGSGQADV